MFGCFGLDSPNKVELQRVLFFAIFGYVYSKSQTFFKYSSVYYSSMIIFKIFFVFQEREHCVFVQKYSKTLISFSVTNRKDSIWNPETSAGSAIAFSMMYILFWSPMTFLDYFVFNRDKSKLATVSRIMSCRHVTTIGN